MKPRRLIERTRTATGQDLVLYQRDDVFQIDVDNYELMSSRTWHSEEALARMALEAVVKKGRHGGLRVLIGGLGMGFTLRVALDQLDALGVAAGSVVEVAEIFQTIVDWNTNHFGHLADHPLKDPRVKVTVADVAHCLKAPDSLYDAIVLDVDNGPEALTVPSNDSLYSGRGLTRLHRAVAPKGVVAVWSSFQDPAFLQRFRKAGFDARAIALRARPGTNDRRAKGHRYVVFLGTKR